MKAKLIKTDVNYLLEDSKGVVIGSTSTKEINKLSKQNCDEIFGVVDVEKLAEESWGDKISSPYHSYIEGFNKAMELYQPTEIEVEIETTMRPVWGDESSMRATYVKKLDSEGCLILKKI
jgi:hypothetical protein